MGRILTHNDLVCYGNLPFSSCWFSWQSSRQITSESGKDDKVYFSGERNSKHKETKVFTFMAQFQLSFLSAREEMAQSIINK